MEANLETLQLTEEEKAEKDRLLSEGFGEWHRRDLKSFTSACERHGRTAKQAIYKSVAEETGKTDRQVAAYYKAFWAKHESLADSAKIIEKIEKGEKRIERHRMVENALKIKVAKHKNPWQTLRINYGTNKGKAFTEEEVRFAPPPLLPPLLPPTSLAPSALSRHPSSRPPSLLRRTCSWCAR
jgi:SWI/SNF-related matrix-associated actin-dependent regulator of chromatin subfamily A member 5